MNGSFKILLNKNIFIKNFASHGVFWVFLKLSPNVPFEMKFNE